MSTPAKAKEKENIFVNLLINILIPTLILSKFSGQTALGVKWAIIVALAFPLIYGLYDMHYRGKFNLFSVSGIISIALTGGFALYELPPKYIIMKETAIPAMFAIATLISVHTPYPLVKIFLYNDNIMQIDKIAKALAEQGTEKAFERALINASYLVTLSFIVSSILNFALAKYLLVSEPGTEAFNSELGKMNALSFPVIAIPAVIVLMFALFYLFKKIKVLTQLELEEILNHPK